MMKVSESVLDAQKKAFLPQIDHGEADWTTASESDLRVAAFGEGIPGQTASTTDDPQGPIVVYMDEEKVKMPFGFVETAPFLELLWRKTGADCDGEEEEMEFPGHRTYTILLRESREPKL